MSNYNIACVECFLCADKNRKPFALLGCMRKHNRAAIDAFGVYRYGNSMQLCRLLWLFSPFFSHS